MARDKNSGPSRDQNESNHGKATGAGGSGTGPGRIKGSGRDSGQSGGGTGSGGDEGPGTKGRGPKT